MFEKAVLIFCILLGQSAAGQEPVDSKEPHGLLGQRYVTGLLRFQQPTRNHQPFYDLDSTSVFALNLPVKWTEDNVAAFSQDVFFSMSDLNPFQNEKAIAQVRINGDNIGNFPGIEVIPFQIAELNLETQMSGNSQNHHVSTPRYRYSSIGNFHGHQFQIGTTLYGAFRHDLRPFVQVGYAHTVFRQHNVKVNYVSSPSGENFTAEPLSTTSQYTYHRMVCNPGVEWDLSEHVTLRPQIDLDTQNIGKGSRCSAQLIWWFHKDWFLSPGILCNINGTQPGTFVNLGLSF